MDSDKHKAGSALHEAPPKVETDPRINGRLDARIGAQIDARIVQSKLVSGGELSIADDDRGGDPYNSTGAYCIIKPKTIAGE